MTNETNETILQNLRDFTVQIRRPDGETIVGTGLAVSLDGQIVTCAHVVAAAIGKHPRQATGAEITVYFPQARGGEAKARRATIAACFPDHDDDVVLLQLDGPPPLSPEQMPKLGAAEPSRGHGFRSYGYAPVGNRLSRYAHGEIMGPVEMMSSTPLHAEPVELRTRNIRRGMSGGPVLDTERNLVVGLVTSYWLVDEDPDNIAYATNGRVLTFEPLNVPLQDEPEPKKPAPQPQPEYQDAAREVARQSARTRLESQFYGAPPPLKEWVGRADLLAGLTRDYNDPERRVTGLIGFGGEGKSSLARKWVALLDDFENRPTGVFWWGFYENRNVDEFFEAALAFLSGGLIDPQRIPSSSAKAQVIAALLANGRYVFVLDGLEVLQRQEGDEYGLLTSPDLQTFLELFAAPGHESFCLVTSRAPLLDLLAYTSYIHRDVGPVTPEDGRALLRELGVQERDDELDELVAQWDGHALTLSLLGTYLAWRHGGAVAYAGEFDPVEGEELAAADAPDEARQRYAHVHRILRRYDEHLTAAERAFMMLFSAFRTPVRPDAFGRVFRGESTDYTDFTDDDGGRGGPRARPGEGDHKDKGDHKGSPLQAVLAGLSETEFAGLVARLVGYRLLRHNAADGTYTTHPLVRSHYLARLTNSGQAAQTHAELKDYYLELAGDTPHNPTLEQLAPLIEVVYHACRAGAYDEAYQIHRERIRQEQRYYEIHVLGAYETSLNIMLQFFPDGDTSQEPQVSKASDKSWILNTMGFCLMSLGRLDTAVPFYERQNKMRIEQEDWRNASIGYQNLAELNANLGRLAASAAAAAQALELAHRAAKKEDECYSLAWQAWAAHLRGEIDAAGEAFRQAEALERELYSKSHGIETLISLRGIHHAEHLRRVGEAAYARRVTAANLEICERNRWVKSISMCHHVLGELDAAAGQDDAARAHFDTALRLARSISHRPALIEALLARGRWAAHAYGRGGFHTRPGQAQDLPLQQAFSDLREALGYATDGGYRIYEADIRIALAWAHLAAHNPAAARQEAVRAQTMSQETGYHWGQVDAAEVLDAL